MNSTVASSSKASAGQIAFGILLGALSGVLLTLSFSPYDLWFLIWIALVPMVIAQFRVLPPRWSALAPALGVGGFMVGYLGGVFPAVAAWYMKALPLLVGVAVFVSSRGTRASREQKSYGWWPLAAASGWVAIELIRMYIPALATWGFVGYALYRQSWLIQPVRYVGIFGLDLVIVLVNYALAVLAIAFIDRRAHTEGTLKISMNVAVRWCAVASVVMVAWGALSLSIHSHGEPTVRVAALQPGIRRSDLSGSAEIRDRAMLARLTIQTREAAARGARLIVWPEGTFWADPAVAYATEVGNIARETGAYLVIGYNVRSPRGTRNEGITVDPGGHFVGRFGKDHPVGFLGGTSLSRGTYPTLDTSMGTIATMICADTDFTDTGRKLARQGAKILAVPSADWAAIATKHYTLSVFRALETGAAIVKSEYNHDSAIIDGYGRIVASAVTPNGGTAVLVADVPIRDGLPLAARWGDWVGWLCVAAMFGRMIWRRVRPTHKIESSAALLS